MTEQLTYIVQLITALEHIVNICEHNVPAYHPFRHLVSSLVDGAIVLCDGCESSLTNEDGSGMHGLNEQILELYEVMGLLELEVQYELEGEADGEEV